MQTDPFIEQSSTTTERALACLAVAFLIASVALFNAAIGH